MVGCLKLQQPLVRLFSSPCSSIHQGRFSDPKIGGKHLRNGYRATSSILDNLSMTYSPMTMLDTSFSPSARISASTSVTTVSSCSRAIGRFSQERINPRNNFSRLNSSRAPFFLMTSNGVLLDPFECSEAEMALFAFATAADGFPVISRTTIDNTRSVIVTFWALHRLSPFSFLYYRFIITYLWLKNLEKMVFPRPSG